VHKQKLSGWIVSSKGGDQNEEVVRKEKGRHRWRHWKSRSPGGAKPTRREKEEELRKLAQGRRLYGRGEKFGVGVRKSERKKRKKGPRGRDCNEGKKGAA